VAAYDVTTLEPTLDDLLLDAVRVLRRDARIRVDKRGDRLVGLVGVHQTGRRLPQGAGFHGLNSGAPHIPDARDPFR
jgi:hypothetical protein